MQQEDNKAHSVIISIFVTQIFQPMLVMMSKKQMNQGQSLAPLIKHCHLVCEAYKGKNTDTQTHKQNTACEILCVDVHTWMDSKTHL